jgi:hypothetical protein
MLQSIEINYHESDYGPLVLEGLAPIISDVNQSPSVKGSFLYPFWRGGPHINLVVDAPRKEFAEKLYPRAATAIREWLARNPSHNRIDPQSYRQLSREIAETERDPRRPLPLRANNSVRATRYNRPAPMGMAALGHIRDKFLADTIEIQLAVRRQAQNSLQQRLEAILPLLLAIGTVRSGPDFAFWPLSFVAHGKVFLANNPRHADRFEQIYALLRDKAAADVAAAMEDAGPGAPPSPWRAALRKMDEGIAAIVTDRFAELDRHIWAGAEEASVGNDNPLGIAAEDLVVFRNEVHLSWRLLQNFVYLTMPVIGISAAERACACYIIGRLVTRDYPSLTRSAEERMAAMLALGKDRR